MTPTPARRTGPAAVAVALLLALTACGGTGDSDADGGDGGPPTPSPTPAASGPASDSPTPSPTPETVFDDKHTDVEVAPGETFSLKIRINPGAGYDWELVDPQPDSAVVVKTGQREEADSPERMGSRGYLFLDYRTKAEGSTEVHVRRNCFACGGEEEKAAKAGKKGPETVFHITVKE
ncbi:protease inhibitor I42 family protein [Streptomyces smyrnaeus]|uniref:protease inhibitor I42 family protein n=1 Tax=Streptomyces smyrnaeus TaxID=1387713 RepID=UPI0033C8E652